MNGDIKAALLDLGLMETEKSEINLEELKKFLIDSDKLQDRTVKGPWLKLSSGYSTFEQGGVYLAEAIYHDVLNEAQKNLIYCSKYEIGSPKTIDDINILDFYNYLESRYGGSAEDLVKSIKRNISDLTGVPFSFFIKQDMSVSYKVITLFYRVRRQFKSQLSNFFDIENKDGVLFEFKTSHPYQGAKNKGCKNTAILAEILAHLTYSMSEEDLNQARYIQENLPQIGNKLAMCVREYINLTNSLIPQQPVDIAYIADSNINCALNKTFEVIYGRSAYRLDFMLYNLISFKEFRARKLSNRLLFDLVANTPLNLRSLYKGKVNTWSDEDVIHHLLGQDKKVSKNVEKQTDFLEKYIVDVSNVKYFYLNKSSKIREALPLQNRQILKALIIHDSEVKNVRIKSFVFGSKETPTSITAVLKKGAKDLDKSKSTGTLFSYSNYPEAILSYWVMRYELALRMATSENEQEAITQFRRITDFETRIDDMLVNYLIQSDLTRPDVLDSLTNEFDRLLSITITPL